MFPDTQWIGADDKVKCVVTGGGTGGHIYPAIAVAKSIQKIMPSASILYIGTESGMESSLVPKEGLDFMTVRSSGIVGKSPIVALKGIWNAGLGVNDARHIFKEIEPDVVLGTGGYVSGPVVLAASLMGIPCAIQEQNAVPGKTNLYLSKRVDMTFAAWENSLEYFPKNSKVKVTGNPVRETLFSVSKDEGRAFFGLDERFTLLVLGGSRGAESIVQAAISIAREMDEGLQMILVSGSRYYEEAVSELGAVPEDGQEGARTDNVVVRPFVYNMEMAYNACDLVLARAGGMTLAEITALGLPSIIVPSPHVVGNHQELNARALEAEGAALVIREGPNLISEIRDSFFKLVQDEEAVDGMRQASRKIGKPNAAIHIADDLIEMAKKRE
ncbi:MAG: undecaprenyldiphospho-muramoylpentapeptide beta-N-acetylglucosaminyltransferase [Bacillota bacterium]